MKTDKVLKITLYSLLGLGAILGASLLLKGKKDDDKGKDENAEADVEDPDAITEEQKKVPPKIVSATKDKTVAKGMRVFAKLNAIKGRSQNYVNNGYINNIIWEGDNAGEYLGTVTATAKDRENSADDSGKIYTWFKVTLDRKAWDRYNNTKSFLTKQTAYTAGNNWAWFREDTLKA